MSSPQYVELRHGDCIELMRELPDNSIDSIVTDPPYGLEFMGKEWDSFGESRDPRTAGRSGMGTQTGGAGVHKDSKTPQGRTGVAFGGNKPMTYRCRQCGKKDQFRTKHKCEYGWTRVPIYDGAPKAMLGFQAWFTEVATEALRVLKPGGHLLAFGGTRTYHRLAVAIEDAGFEIRDSMMWLYGSGFPKSHDVSKAIDKRGGAQVAWFGSWFRKWREDNGITQKQVAALFLSKSGGLTGCVANWELGFNMPTPEQFNLIRDTFGLPFASIVEAEREVIGKHPNPAGSKGNTFPLSQECNITAPATPAAQQWQGWGTALKPAHEPIVVARKPLIGTVAENVLEWGVGAMNIDGCRVGTTVETWPKSRFYASGQMQPGGKRKTQSTGAAPPGRWPANVVLSHTIFCDDTCAEGCPVAELDRQSGNIKSPKPYEKTKAGWLPPTHEHKINSLQSNEYGDTGGASRFFYVAKASKRERPKVDGVAHPTVKPLALMRWLVRLVTPPNGTVLEPFAGSGTTVEAALLEGFSVLAFEKTADYLPLIRERIRRTDTGANT